MSVTAIPHERNGAKCPICGRPVYHTDNGWRDSNGNGSHRQPAPRVSPWPDAPEAAPQAYRRTTPTTDG